MSNRPLSLKDFKNWMTNQPELTEFFNIGMGKDEDPNEKYIGKGVKAKVSTEKLREKIETEDDADELIEEFIEEGGTVLTVEGKKVQIEVESGTFYLPRFCVKIHKSE